MAYATFEPGTGTFDPSKLQWSYVTTRYADEPLATLFDQFFIGDHLNHAKDDGTAVASKLRKYISELSQVMAGDVMTLREVTKLMITSKSMRKRFIGDQSAFGRDGSSDSQKLRNN